MADSGLRLLLILKKLPRAPRCISTRQIHEQLLDDGYQVTLRTIQRDMDTLSAHFPIIQTAPTGKGKAGAGWAFHPDSKHTGIPLMDPSAALTLLMGMEHLQQILPPQVASHLHPLQAEAEDTLQQIDRRNYHSWIDKVRVIPQHILQPAQIDEASLQAVYTALLDNRQFVARYNGKPDQLIHPYGLVQRGTTIYLLCRFFHFDDVRITALHRYADVRLLNDSVRPFPDFHIDDYLGTGIMHWPWDNAASIRLKLRINDWLAGYLTESPLADNQKIAADNTRPGWYNLQATVMDSHELRWWLLSQGGSLQVLGPKSLRCWFAENAKTQLDYYLTPASDNPSDAG